MDKLYIVTGAAGHLGSTIIKYLVSKGCFVRGLILPTEFEENSTNVTYFKGDVTKPESLEDIFNFSMDNEAIVIHAAGIISIANEVSPLIYNVNVNGTKNIIDKCLSHHVKRLVYVSSVHAIPEPLDRAVISETNLFSKDKVIGAYAKTKAEATQMVLNAVKSGLDAVIVHPSGILGPYDNGNNHLVQLVKSYISGKLPVGTTGGYDFVDVRDVAQGCISAALNGRNGECYILSNRYYRMKDLLRYMSIVTKGPRKLCIPIKIAGMFTPIAEWVGKLTKKRPLFTRYSLYTIGKSNGNFSHDKATMELKYQPRDILITISDTVKWLEGKMYINPSN